MGPTSSLRRLVLLPGLDGTGTLFAPFVRQAPPGVLVETVALPAALTDYAALAEWSDRNLMLDPGTVLLGESFSGPLALLLAARRKVAAVVLVNTFIVPPYPPAWRHFVVPCAFIVPPPARALRARLVGPAASDAMVAEARRVIAGVPPRVMAARLRAMLGVDVRAEVATVTAGGTPLVYLRGTADGLVPERSVTSLVAAAKVPPTVIRLDGPHLLLQMMPEASWSALAPWVR